MFIVVIDTIRRKYEKYYLFIRLFYLESQNEGIYFKFNLRIFVVSIPLPSLSQFPGLRVFHLATTILDLDANSGLTQFSILTCFIINRFWKRSLFLIKTSVSS